MILRYAATAILLTGIGHAQWINTPLPGVPRLANGQPNLAAPVPKALDGKPDLTGIWARLPPPNAPAGIALGGSVPGKLAWYMPKDAEIPLQPAAAALYQKRSEALGMGRPTESCLPHGVPDGMLYGGPLKLIQNPAVTAILYEEFNHFRQVFTDGRVHPPSPDPAWFGYSVGKWEGDTLVVDTIGYNDKSWMDDNGLPHTDALHTIERFRRTDYGHMEAQVTIDDPKAYTKPWQVTLKFRLQADTELMESICENEKDVRHMSGK